MCPHHVLISASSPTTKSFIRVLLCTLTALPHHFPPVDSGILSPLGSVPPTLLGEHRPSILGPPSVCTTSAIRFYTCYSDFISCQEVPPSKTLRISHGTFQITCMEIFHELLNYINSVSALTSSALYAGSSV